jgi:hypothetical protein
MDNQTPDTTRFTKWSELMMAAFGPQAPIFIAYTLSTAYNHTVVFPNCDELPMLYLEGGPARGKTTAGRAMTMPFHGDGSLSAQAGILLETFPTIQVQEHVRNSYSKVVLFEEYRSHGPYLVDRWLKSTADGLAASRIGAVICSMDGLIDPALKTRCIVVPMTTDYRQSATAKTALQTLNQFQRDNGPWLSNMKLPALPEFSDWHPKNLALLTKLSEHSGIETEARNLRNLATLYTVVECWDFAGHKFPFLFSELWKQMKATLKMPVASK